MDLIEKYLKPLEKDAEKEKQMGLALKELRNQMVFSFLMINSIWCLTIFLLQENKDLVSLIFLLVSNLKIYFWFWSWNNFVLALALYWPLNLHGIVIASLFRSLETCPNLTTKSAFALPLDLTERFFLPNIHKILKISHSPSIWIFNLTESLFQHFKWKLRNKLLHFVCSFTLNGRSVLRVRTLPTLAAMTRPSSWPTHISSSNQSDSSFSYSLHSFFLSRFGSILFSI